MPQESAYTSEIGERICERLACGESLLRICTDPQMPSYSTARKWQAQHEQFAADSARAREWGTDYLADECIIIADEAGADPATKRVRVDTRLRLIGKWNARRYGDKLDHNHSGSVHVTLASVLAGIGADDDQAVA